MPDAQLVSCSDPNEQGYVHFGPHSDGIWDGKRSSAGQDLQLFGERQLEELVERRRWQQQSSPPSLISACVGTTVPGVSASGQGSR